MVSGRCSGLDLAVPAIVDGPVSQPVRVDTSTGQLTIIGPTGFGVIGGLAFDHDGKLFGITSNQSVPPVLLLIDPQTGQASVVVQTDLQQEASSLEIDANGRLLTAGDDGNLYEINSRTGVSSLIGPMGVSKLSGLSFGPPSVR